MESCSADAAVVTVMILRHYSSVLFLRFTVMYL